MKFDQHYLGSNTMYEACLIAPGPDSSLQIMVFHSQHSRERKTKVSEENFPILPFSETDQQRTLIKLHNN